MASAQGDSGAELARNPILAQASDSAETVARTFVDHFKDSDYFSAWFLLSPAAKQGFVRTTATLNIKSLLQIEGMSLPGSVFLNTDGPRSDLVDDFRTDPSLLFDDLLYAGEQSGTLPFLFGPQASIIEVDIDGIVANASIHTDGEPANLGLHLVQLSDKTWRVDRVTWDGADQEGAKPWALPVN